MISRQAFVHPDIPPYRAILLGIVWIVLFISFGFPRGEVKKSLEVFAFNRLAEAKTFVAIANDDLPEWVQRVFFIHDEQIEQSLLTHYQTAERWGLFPEESRNHWSTALLSLGNHQAAFELLSVDFSESDIQKRQRAILQELAAPDKASLEQLDWSQRRYSEGISDLPDWWILSQNGYEEIEAWIRGHGQKMIKRGIIFDSLYAICLLGALSVLVFIGKKSPGFPPPRKTSPILHHWNAWFVLEQFFLAEILTLGLTIALFQGFGSDFVSDGELALVQFFFLAFPTVFLALRIFPRTGMSWRTWFRLRNGWNLRTSLRLSMFFVGLGLLSIIPLFLLGTLTLSLSDVIYANSIDTKARAWTLLVGAVILAPFCEEFIMRGCVFGGLLTTMGVWPAALISSGLFAVLHGYSLIGLITVFLMGLGFCWLYFRSGSLWPGILGHAIYNLVVVNQNLAWYSLH